MLSMCERGMTSVPGRRRADVEDGDTRLVLRHDMGRAEVLQQRTEDAAVLPFQRRRPSC